MPKDEFLLASLRRGFFISPSMSFWPACSFLLLHPEIRKEGSKLAGMSVLPLHTTGRMPSRGVADNSCLHVGYGDGIVPFMSIELDGFGRLYP